MATYTRVLDIVESVVLSRPVTLETLSPEQRDALESEATRRRLTPEAVLVLARGEVLANIKASRDARAIALEVRAATGAR
jgi:hypothetical protein